MLGTMEAEAAYSGRTFQISNRDVAHDFGRENRGTSWHYRISRRTKRERSMFAL